VISDFRCEVDEKCAPVGYYAASSGNCLPTNYRSLLQESIPETSVINYCIITQKTAVLVRNTGFISALLTGVKVIAVDCFLLIAEITGCRML